MYLKNLTVFVVCIRREDAANRPKVEFVPKTLAELNVEGLSENMNGGSIFNTYGQEKDDPFDPWSKPPAKRGDVCGDWIVTVHISFSNSFYLVSFLVKYIFN